jgi:uncharacterized Zn finger protein
MKQLSKTWWGNRFIQALEAFSDPARLSRGRSYANSNRIHQLDIVDSVIHAKVRGNVNPYFGVYKEPTYNIEIVIHPISQAQWAAAIAYIASKASFISKLLLNEMPDNIEDAFQTLGLHLLPKSKLDFETHCSCPDWGNPCKHVAGVYYRVAKDLDRDPFLLFELRGLPRKQLHAELAKSPLGQALIAELNAEASSPDSVTSYYTRPQLTALPKKINPKTFWQGERPFPKTVEVLPPSAVSGILVKKQGDFTTFWQKDNSFIAAINELYDRVKTKNRDLL